MDVVDAAYFSVLATTWSMPAGSRDSWPWEYERGRPGWPRETVELPRLPPVATVLDVGAGTGKLTRLLASAFDGVIAVEPAEAMRRLLVTVCPEAEVRSGTGQRLPLPDSCVDAVFAAEAFHWFDDDPALAEIGRVLRPGGALVLMWNLPAGPWELSITAVEQLLCEQVPEGDLGYDPLDLGGPRRADGELHASFAAARFEPLRKTRMTNPQTLDREGLVAYFASMGWIADLPDQVRLPLLAEVRSLLTANEYGRRWETHVYWTRLPHHLS